MPRIPIKWLKLSAAGLIALAIHEGYRSNAYLDTVGIWTVGFGETKNVTKDTKTTPERALVHMLNRIERDFTPEVKECMGDGITLHQYEFDAYVGFSYNIGTSGFCNSTTLKYLKQGKYEEACNAMMLWTKNKELIGRRKEEVQMCLGK